MTQINNDNELHEFHELAGAERIASDLISEIRHKYSYCAQDKIREIREIRGRKER